MAASENLTKNIARVKADIDRELELFFDHKIAEAGRIDPQYKRLITEMKKFAMRGGKRLRPFMAWLGYELASGRDYKKFIRTAAALEMYHQFALIHDDVMDQDTRRYGGPNVQGVYERFYGRTHDDTITQLHAQNAALLAGDIALGFAFEIIANSPFEAQVRERLNNELIKLHFTLAGGQFLDDVAVLHKELNPRKIRKTYYYKTARYSMIVPLTIGGMLAEANDTILQILERYGQHAGIAFQIVDDLLGMYGSTKEIGKPVLSDLQEGKRTILMYYGFKFADETQKVILKRNFGNPNVSMHDLKLVRKVLTDNGAKAKTIFMAQAEADAAKKAIGKLALPGELPELFNDLTTYLVDRKF